MELFVAETTVRRRFGLFALNFNMAFPYDISDYSEQEIVSPLETTNKILRQALSQCAESEIQITLKLGDKK